MPGAIGKCTPARGGWPADLAAGAHRRRAEQRVIEQRTYNANGQIEVERAGNGVVSVLTYNPLDDRLQRRQTWRTGKPGEPLQDLTYTYDRVGNVLKLADAAQPLQWADNSRAQAVSNYAYDTLYQLIEATGRKIPDPAHGPQLPVSFSIIRGSAQRLRNYRQVYTYDAGGNLASCNTPSPATARAIPSDEAGAARLITALSKRRGWPPTRCRAVVLMAMATSRDWSPARPWPGTCATSCSEVTLVARAEGANDEEIYVYDGGGARVLKVRQRHGHRLPRNEAVYYLPGLIRRNSATGQWLDGMTIAGELSSARILHWEQGRPADIENTSCA